MIILPSLEIVPAKFNGNILLSQIPVNGTGDFTVSRALNTATRVNSSGNIEVVNADTPRIDYLTSSGTVGCPALLVEPSAQNLAFHSTDWTNNWNGGSASGTTIITNSTISFAPDGTATANEIHPTSGNTNHARTSNSTTAVTYVSGTVYTQSAFFKAGIGVGIQVQLNNPIARFSQSGYANFDLIAGTVLVVSGTTADTNRAARIENYGNGWYRCSYTATCTSAGTGVGVIPILISASGDTRSPSFSGTVTDYLLGWGAQLETGSVATSYIPTTTAAVTRGAEAVDRTGISSLMGQTEGAFYLDMSYFAKGGSGATLWLYIVGTPTSNNIGLGVLGTSVRSIVNGQSDLLSTPSTANGVKIAWGYDGSGVVCFVNGVQYNLPNGGNQIITSMNRCIIDMSSAGGTRMADVRIRAAALYPTRLTDTQLALLTSPYTSYSSMASALSYTLG
jgi:hypothetical protein